MHRKLFGSHAVKSGERAADLILSLLTSRISFWLLSVGLLAYIGWSLTVVRTWSTVDYWEHLATIGAFARNLVSPDNPYTGPGNPIHLFTPYHLFWGAVCRLTGVQPVLMSPVIGVVNIGLLILASAVLATHLLRERRLSLVVVITFLFFWFQPWKWSGFYCFGFLPTTSVYPFWSAIPLALIVLSLFMEPRYRSAIRIIIFSLIAAVIFLIHPLTGMFLYMALVVKSLLLKDCPTPQRISAVSLLAAGGALVLLWPYFPVLDAILTGPFEFNYYFFYQQLPIRLAPMVLALPALVYAVARKQYDFLFVSLILLGAVYVANFFVMQKAPTARLVTYIILCLHIFTVRTFQLSMSRRIGPVWILLFLVMIAAFAPLQIRESLGHVAIEADGSYRTSEADGSTLDSGHNLQIIRKFGEMSPRLGPGDVVLAEVIESWILPVAVPCRVVYVAHTNPFMTDYLERKEFGKTFFAGTLAATDADNLITRFKVSHILLKESQLGLLRNVTIPFSEVWRGHGYCLYRLVPA